MADQITNPESRNGTYTWRDYMTWPDSGRWELIRGTAWCMSPSPGWRHQKVTINLAARLQAFLKGKPCQPFISPMDVFLPRPGQTRDKLDDIDTVIQPDLGVVCDPSKIMERGIWGGPELVMEVVSPSSVLRDMNLKKEIYAELGCREYWIWEAGAAWVIVYRRLPEGGWDPGFTFGPEDRAISTFLEGFVLDMKELRAELA